MLDSRQLAGETLIPVGTGEGDEEASPPVLRRERQGRGRRRHRESLNQCAGSTRRLLVLFALRAAWRLLRAWQARK